MNITKFVPAAVTTRFARQLLIAQKNSPQILFGVGIASGITSTVLACRATLKLDEVLAQAEEIETKAKQTLDSEMFENYTVKDYNKDLAIVKIRTVAKVAALYGPAIGAGAIAVACFAGGQAVLTKRNFALTAAYGALDKGFKEYRERVEKELGVDKERELRYATEETKVEEDGKTKKVHNVTKAGGSIYAKFFDEYTKNWKPEPEYNRIFIRAQQQYANDLLNARGHLLLNEVYDMLGIERSSAGCVVGWLKGAGGDDYVDFGVFNDDPAHRDFVNGREPSILLDFNVDGTIYDKI